MEHTIKHSGFTRPQMAKLYQDAGLEDFGWYVDPTPMTMELQKGTRQRTMFITKGRRSATTLGKLKNWVWSLQAQTAGQMSLQPDERYT